MGGIRTPKEEHSTPINHNIDSSTTEDIITHTNTILPTSSSLSLPKETKQTDSTTTTTTKEPKEVQSLIQDKSITTTVTTNLAYMSHLKKWYLISVTWPLIRQQADTSVIQSII